MQGGKHSLPGIPSHTPVFPVNQRVQTGLAYSQIGVFVMTLSKKVKNLSLAFLLIGALTFGSGIAFGVDIVPAAYACGSGGHGGGGC